MAKQSTKDQSEKETERRRDNALARALFTPHKPHKPLKATKKKPRKKSVD